MKKTKQFALLAACFFISSNAMANATEICAPLKDNDALPQKAFGKCVAAATSIENYNELPGVPEAPWRSECPCFTLQELQAFPSISSEERIHFDDHSAYMVQAFVDETPGDGLTHGYAAASVKPSDALPIVESNTCLYYDMEVIETTLTE